MATLRPPWFDLRPVFTPCRRWAGATNGATWAWVGYGFFHELPSRCFWVVDWGGGEDDEGLWFPPAFEVMT